MPEPGPDAPGTAGTQPPPPPPPPPAPKESPFSIRTYSTETTIGRPLSRSRPHGRSSLRPQPPPPPPPLRPLRPREPWREPRASRSRRWATWLPAEIPAQRFALPAHYLERSPGLVVPLHPDPRRQPPPAT